MSDTGPNGNAVPGEAVEEPSLFSCGTHDLHERLLASDNQYKNARANISAILEQSGPRTDRITGHIRIPVVVHVVWHTQDQKISMEQVENQIDALNRDFNLQNKDIADVPSRWQDRVGNPNISFFLAKRDPTGNAHDGVVWIWTSISQFGDSSDSRMKLAEKGSPGWDSSRFLNIWVCNMTDLCGYATFPGGAPALDGVAIQWDDFGSLGKSVNPSYNLGRTAVHEVGHWLNLPHTFAGQQAVISDTPRVPVNEKNFGKPFYPKISKMRDETTNEADGGDMFMNYMDYCDDDTTIMFTKGQVARMRKTLATQRRSVFWSDFHPLKNQDTSFERSDDTTVYMLLDWYDNGCTTLAAIKITKASPQTTTIQLTNNTGDLSSAIKSIETKVPDQSSEDSVYTLARELGVVYPSLFAVRRSGGASGFVEVQMFSPDFYANSETMKTLLPAVENSRIWSFAFVNWSDSLSGGPPDLVAIKQSDTTNGKVEFHVLSSKTTLKGRYQTWLAHRYTALDEVADEAHFMFTDWNGDGTLDLAVVQRKADASGWLVDILAGAANYRDFLVRTEVGRWVLDTDEKVNYDFAMLDMTKDGRPDLVAIQKSGSEKVELIVLAG